MIPKPLVKVDEVVPCTIMERVNRFTVEVFLDGRKTKAYLHNTGRLSGYLNKGNKGFCIPIEKPKKLCYRLIGARGRGGVAIIDTELQMRAFERALELELIPWLMGWKIAGRNMRLGMSLIDYLLVGLGRTLYLEVKSSVWREKNFALYPDCPTLRGQKHLRELADYAKGGGEAVILFIAALRGVGGFKPARAGDPKFCELLASALESGVNIKAMSIHYHPKDSVVYLENPDLSVMIY